VWQQIRNMLRGEKKEKYKGDGYDFTRWFEPYSIFANRTGHTLATHETIFAAVTILANAMASLPIKLYRNFEVVNNQISDLLVNSPNPNLSSFYFIRTLEVHRDTYGNGYALKMYDDRAQVGSLIILDPACVTPVIEANTNEIWYQIDADKGTYYVYGMDMIHVKHIHSKGHEGISPLKVLRNALDFNEKLRQFSLDQMDGSLKSSFLLKMPQTLSMEQKQRVVENFRSFYRENGGVIIQDSGVEIDYIDRKFIDQDALTAEKVTRSKVAMVYNLPPHMLGDTEGASFSSMEQQSLQFVQNTLLPIVRMYEQEFNRKLLTARERSHGLSFKFNVNALLRGDMQTRGDFYTKGIRSGWFKPNEVRAWEELPPESGGDTLYISGDLYPIDWTPEQRKGVNPNEEVLGNQERNPDEG
jgi:HK97 family phage portal protein